MTKKNPKHYVDNKKFQKVMEEYNVARKQAIRDDKPIPKAPDFVGECILNIAKRLSYASNFRNYSFKEDMIADGIENGVMAIDNYDPEKWNSPFSYFSRVIYFAFVRRIQKEKKQLYIKYKVTENSVVQGSIVTNGDGASQEYVDLNNDYMTDFVSNYERSMEEKKIRRAESKRLKQEQDNAE